MKLLNRAGQRYLLRREGRPVVGIPGTNAGIETGWDLIEVKGAVAIISSVDSNLCLRPTESGVVCESVASPASAAWWSIQTAGDGYQFIAESDNPELVLATVLSDDDDLALSAQPHRDRSAMWLEQAECVPDARSVHLRYAAPSGVALFYNEVVLEEVPPGTFFCLAGFGANARGVSPSGYGGVQRRTDGSRIAIFSVWHRMVDDVNANPDALAYVLGAAPGAETTLFSGEGSGSSVRFPFEWAEDDNRPIRFAVTAERIGSDTALAAYIAQGAEPWLNLGVILRSETGGLLLSHPYGFIEDFARNGNTEGVVQANRSPYRLRSGVFRNPWFALPGQPPAPGQRAELTAYSPHPLESIVAGVDSPSDFGIRVATGGRVASERPPIGTRFADEGPQRRIVPDLAAVPLD